MSILERVRRFLGLPADERSRLLRHKLRQVSALPFLFGRASLLNVQLTYRPDSKVYFHKFAESDELFRRFVRRNRNNAGDSVRLWSLILNLQQLIDERIAGDFAELGVWRGNTAAVLAHFAAKGGRQVVLFDTFEGFSQRDLVGDDSGRAREFDDTSIDLVADVIGENRRVCEFVCGRFPDSIRESDRERRFAAVSIDCDLYTPMKEGLAFFYPRMARGGLLLLHDYSSGFWPGAKRAIDEFCELYGERLILMPDKSGSAFVRKSA